MARSRKARSKAVSPTEQILGRSLRAAERDPSSVFARRTVEARWRKSYERLLEMRDSIIDQETRLHRESNDNQPQFLTNPGADTANDAFEQDKALGTISTYQEMLDEVNQALARIENRTYGVCELTGRPIGRDRLKAIPWTRFSVAAERQLESRGEPLVHFEIPPQFSARDVIAGRTEVESELHRRQPGDRLGAWSRTGDMPAKSKKQQMAAGAALAAKRGQKSKGSLRGASKSMASSMSEKELKKMASAKRKKLPTRVAATSSKKSSATKPRARKSSGAKSRRRK